MDLVVRLMFCGLVATAYGVTYKGLIFEEFEAFKAAFNKIYNDEYEELFRLKIFMENKLKIAQHNLKFSNGEHTFSMHMNQFGDLLHHEFLAEMNGLRKGQLGQTYNATTHLPLANVVHPEHVDWREAGYVTPVKDQGHCGSCWAFSTTGSLEGQHFRKSGKLVSLSEQNLVDCSISYGNNGCGGGLMNYAFQYVKDNQGIDTEKSYPYEAEDDKCRFSTKNVGATDTGFVDIPQFSEASLKEALATIGPVSVAIDASLESFQFYSQGVYKVRDCSQVALDHGVLAVGYGTENGLDYWLVKNSWSTTWGEEGYIKMARNENNMCGIASMASYPLV